MKFIECVEIWVLWLSMVVPMKRKAKTEKFFEKALRFNVTMQTTKNYYEN